MNLSRDGRGDWSTLGKGKGLSWNDSESSGFDCTLGKCQAVIIEIEVPYASPEKAEIIYEKLQMELAEVKGDLCVPFEQVVIQSLKADLAKQLKPRVLIGIFGGIKFGIKSEKFVIDGLDEQKAIKEALEILLRLFGKK